MKNLFRIALAAALIAGSAHMLPAVAASDDSSTDTNDAIQQMHDYISDPKQSTTPGDILLPGASPIIHNTDSDSNSDSNSNSDSGSDN